MKGSWKTTALGIFTILSAISGAGMAFLDMDPATNPDWTVLIAAVTAGGGLIFSRDNDVKSEAVGAK